jgi:DNA-binding NarL/FixJ family response regulator
MHATQLIPPTPVLVCATPDPGAPQVVLADGSYETDAERVFWRHTRRTEVLRLPLQTEVSVRPVRRFDEPVVPVQRTVLAGEQRLLAAVAQHRAEPAATPVAVDSRQVALRRRLARALTHEDQAAAEAAAAVLWRQQGLAATHDALAACLADVGAGWAAGTFTVRAERALTSSVRAVLERLHATSAAQATGDPVVLLTPTGDRHTLALTALAHQLHEAGRRSLVVDDLPMDELAALLRERSVPAVAVSAHLPLAPAAVRELVATVRTASPRTLIVLGGPGVPRTARGTDLVTEEPAALLRLLDGTGTVLTPRESEVLQAVAEGLTNSDIAGALGLSAATVKTHLDHVFAKTGTEHRAAAVARALRQGWIT